MGEKIFRKVFDCEHCGAKGVPASRTECYCTAAPPPRDKWYREIGAEPVTDPKELRAANAGGHWKCGHCRHMNLATVSSCSSCGSSKVDFQYQPKVVSDSGRPSIVNESPPHRSLRSEPIALTTSVEEAHDSSFTPTSESSYVAVYKRSNTKRPSINGYALILGLLAAGLLIFGIWAVQTHEVKAMVVSQSWKYSIDVEDYRTVREEDSSIPAGGRYVSDRERVWYEDIYEDRRVKVDKECSHTVDLGNGYEKEEPYDCSYYTTERVKIGEQRHSEILYTYDIDRWVFLITHPKAGVGRQPQWPEVTLAYDGQTVLGAQRISAKRTEFWVFFTDEKREKHEVYLTDLEKWLKYNEGEVFILVYNNLGMLVKDPLDNPVEKR